MAELNMPRLSDTMEEGTIGRWLKKPGEEVKQGEIIVEIETDKAMMELEAYENGYLQSIIVNEGETVAIGTPIAMIGDSPVAANGDAGGGAPAAAPTSAAPAATAPTAAAPAVAAPEATNGHVADGERVKASPVARRLATEYGVDLRLVPGTGPGGRIVKENVEAYYREHGSSGAAAPAAAAPAPAAPPVTQAPAATPAPAAAPAAATAPVVAPPPAPAPAPPPTAPATATVEPMSRMRRAIAKAMTTAKPGVPHIYVTAEVDMAAAMELRKELNASGAAPVKISVNDLVVKAAAKALRQHRAMNASFVLDGNGKEAILYHPMVNVCVAVALNDGLVAPVVQNADQKSIGTIAAEIKDMAGRAREGKIRADELDKGTFTVSNLGMYGVVEFGAVITSPQSGILAVGGVRQVPVVRDGELAVGQVMYITASADHRVADGSVAAQFLQTLRGLLENPLGLLV